MKAQVSIEKSTPAKVNLWVDLIIFTIVMLALSPRFTGVSLHEWLGLGLGAGLSVHLLLHWKWIVTVIRRFFSQLPSQSRLNLLINSALFIDMTVVTFTGLMISREVLPLFGLAVPGGNQWRGLHTLSANLILVLTGLHVAVHWKWIVNSVKRYLLSPLVNHGQTLVPQPRASTSAARPEAKWS